jgi:hypothetical protein
MSTHQSSTGSNSSNRSKRFERLEQVERFEPDSREAHPLIDTAVGLLEARTINDP